MSENRARHAAPANKARGRHRLPDPVGDPANITALTTGSIPVVGERRAALMLERTLLSEVAEPPADPAQRAGAVAATTGLLLISTMSGGIANAATQESELAPQTGSNRIVEDNDVITAPAVKLPQTRVQVKTKPAPPPAPVEPPAPTPSPVPLAGPRHAAPVALEESPVIPPLPSRAPAVVTPAPPAPSSKGEIIAAAALGQLGRMQDCTMLVTNALAAVGINFHDWPAGYFALGTFIPAAQALPGDLIYYANGGTGSAHIAVYVGDNVAVHGGWNGNQTVTYSVYIGSGPVFIRVR